MSLLLVSAIRDGDRFAGSVWRATTYGSARWASADEIGQAGPLVDRGVLLGRVAT
jgi:type IV secretion system protein VirD4